MTSAEKPSHTTENPAYVISRTGEHSFSFCDENGTVYKFSIGEQTDIHVHPKNGNGVIFRNDPFDHREGVFNSDNIPGFVPSKIADAFKSYLRAKVEHTGVPTQEVLDATAAVIDAVQSQK